MSSPSPSLSPATDLGRVAALDAVRGFALCMVLLLHCFWMKQDGSLYIDIVRSFIRSGWLSLHLFFVLSGFLITGILIRAKGKQNFYRDFYIRRMLRILPAYYLLLAIIFFVYPIFNEELRHSGLNEEWPYLVFHVQNLRVAYGDQFPWHGVGHFWSLGVEEQFYLLWPVLIALLPLRYLPAFCACIFVFSSGLRIAMVLGDAPFITVFVGTLTNLDGLAAGSWVAAVTAQSPQPSRRQINGVAIAGGLGLLGLAVLFLRYGGIPGNVPKVVMTAIPLMVLASAMLIYRIHHNLLGKYSLRFFNLPVLVWLGRYSYGIYLIHAVILLQVVDWAKGLPFEWLAGHQNRWVFVSGVVNVTLTIALAWLMFRYVEAPALRLARKLTPSQSRRGEHPNISQ